MSRPTTDVTVNRKRIVRGVIAAVCCASVAGCGPASQDEEVQIGAQEAQRINAQLPMLDDPVVAGFVDSLGRAIAARTSRADLQWHFAVVNTPVVNAFALPGGYIYVNRGVLEHARSMDELAGVLGHEIEHVVLRHSVRQMQKAQEAQTGVSIVCSLTRICEHTAAQVGIQVAGSLAFAKFSRQDEQAADSGGFQNVVASGIDPKGMLTFFEKLANEEQRAGGNAAAVIPWFTDHPGTQDRIAEIERMLETVPPSERRRLVADTPEYQAMRERLASLPPAPESRQPMAP